jgi:hypothetical protein
MCKGMFSLNNLLSVNDGNNLMVKMASLYNQLHSSNPIKLSGTQDIVFNASHTFILRWSRFFLD